MKENKKSPLISVITIVFNDVFHIEQTILSVINQSYDSIEYIIIDGESNDGTIDIIRKYKNYYSTLISKKDKGIYDAMNKGISLSHGNWLIFMNSGDIFRDKDTIQRCIFSMKEDNVNYYGDCYYSDFNINYRFRSKLEHKYNFLKHNTFSHQSIFYLRSDLIRCNGYNLKYTISADFNLTYRIFKFNKFLKIDIPISICSLGGVSTVQALLSYKDRLSTFIDERSFFFASLLIALFPLFYLKIKLIRKISNTCIFKNYRKLKYGTEQI